MKYIKLLIAFFLVLNCTNVFSQIIPPVGPPPIGHSPTVSVPVSISVSDAGLALHFNEAIGLAVITITNDAGDIVYQETVDTDATSSVFIPSSSWNTGSYTITITYGTTSLIGCFEIE